MGKNKLKKVSLIIITFVLGISMPLNNVAYSLEVNTAGIVSNNRVKCDNDVRIQDDFYGAVNKEWLSNTRLEDGYISYGTFEEVCGKVNEDIRNIIIDIQKNKDKYDEDADELKVLNLYNNYLDIKKEMN